jgi:uncharacterized protein (DUF58 family)
MSYVARYLDPALVERLNQLQLTARSVVEGATAGLHRSPFKGASVDFRQHRVYVAGDEPKRIDWRVLGRTDRPYVREYQEETNLRAMIMLDRSGSMAYGKRFGTKFDYARRIVAALSYLMLGQTESVGLAIFGEKLDQWLAPHSHSSQLPRVLDLIERADATGASSPDAAMQAVADRLGRRSLVVIVSDLYTPIARLRAGFARLRHERHEVIAVQVIEPDELEFPFRTFSRFRGMEGESPTLCDAALLRRTYMRNLKRHESDLKQACRTLGVELARFVIDRPVDDALVSFLSRRERTR